MNRDQIFFHDLSHFPLVTAKHGGAPAGYSASWIREMEMLVDNPETFVMVVPDMRTEASHGDRKAMIDWQTANMPRLRPAAARSSPSNATPTRSTRSANAAKRWRAPSACRSWPWPRRMMRCSARANCSARPAPAAS